MHYTTWSERLRLIANYKPLTTKVIALAWKSFYFPMLKQYHMQFLALQKGLCESCACNSGQIKQNLKSVNWCQYSAYTRNRLLIEVLTSFDKLQLMTAKHRAEPTPIELSKVSTLDRFVSWLKFSTPLHLSSNYKFTVIQPSICC